MEVTKPTEGWERVGETFYRKTQLYTAVFNQDLDLDNYIVAGAPYGGAVGEKLFVPWRSSGDHQPVQPHASHLTDVI